jgi:hypothetical protein
VNTRVRKRMFISLLLGLEVLIAAALVLLWVVPAVGYERLMPGLTWVMAAVFGAILLGFSLGVVLLVVTIARGAHMPGVAHLLGSIIRSLLGPVTLLGRLVGISRDDVRRSFIGINNELVRSAASGKRPSRILILMPHCVQNDACDFRITTDVANCRGCGKCDFSRLTPLVKRLGLRMMVATGGTLARRVVVEARPEAIIGVACERDLSAGILDAWPIPVYGVLLDRPNGPCFNTRVAVEKVVDALKIFLPDGELESALPKPDGVPGGPLGR